MRPFSRWSAWLCLLLILWSAGAVVAHQHADGTESAQCSVCVAAQTASPAVLALLLIIGLIVICHAKAAAQQAPKQHLAVFALTVRPPPQSAS